MAGALALSGEVDHVFLQRGSVEATDLKEVLNLSATGRLEWGIESGVAAFGTNVDHSLGMEVARRCNLLEVRVSFVPHKITELNYLQMRNAGRQCYEVDENSDPTLIELATRVLRVGELALRVRGGRLGGTIDDCATCERPTGHLGTYSAAHGISGAVLSGTEQYGCVVCD